MLKLSKWLDSAASIVYVARFKAEERSIVSEKIAIYFGSFDFDIKYCLRKFFGIYNAKI